MGIPPTTAKRAVVKGTKDMDFFVEKKKGKKSTTKKLIIIKVTSKQCIRDLSWRSHILQSSPGLITSRDAKILDIH